MMLSNNIRVNSASGTYVPGNAFTTEKWIFIVGVYDTCLKLDGTCSIWKLASIAKISLASAHKAVSLYTRQHKVPTKKIQVTIDPVLVLSYISNQYIISSFIIFIK